MTFETSEDQLHCTQCEELGEISYSTLQRQHLNIPVKIWVKNLPEGISESGLKNLFLTVGKPVGISFDPKNSCALVFFKTIKEAELAVRDLHCKPPYNLKVVVVTPRSRNGTEEKKQGNNTAGTELSWDFSHQEESVKDEDDDYNIKTDEIIYEIKNIITNLSYDPSLRMRQKKLDFKTGSDCVSMGRGYLFMGTSDRFVGGLQKFDCASKISKAKNKMNFFCEYCKALTAKICWDCSVPFCSKICLIKGGIYHKENCLASRNSEVKSSIESGCSDLNFDNPSANAISSEYLVPLQTGCTVLISTYLSMNTVYVRRSDEPWEEKFTNLCNDVAVEAMKGEKLEKNLQVGDLVIGKYYQDLCFYRAQVCLKTKEKIILFFIDFGNRQETNFEDIKPLPNHLKAEPSFAVKVQLKDVPEGSSPESVNYFNNLTAKRIPLILNLDGSSEVVLSEKDLGEVVNETVSKFLLPSWKRDESVYSKLGEVYYLDSIEQQKLEIGKTLNLIISHFDEKEFLESEVFWVTNPETDDFFHANSEMYLKIKEYCDFLKDDYYLPRVNELCLAKENGEWHRCVNLKSHKTTCCLFFIDDGRSSLIDTSNIRKMVQDFTEASSQVVCCTLPNNPKLKANEKIQSKVVQYLKESTGQTICSVCVLELMGDAYCLSIPEIDKILAEFEADSLNGMEDIQRRFIMNFCLLYLSFAAFGTLKKN